MQIDPTDPTDPTNQETAKRLAEEARLELMLINPADIPIEAHREKLILTLNATSRTIDLLDKYLPDA